MDAEALAQAVIATTNVQRAEGQASIAQRCGCSVRTVGRWLRAYRHYCTMTLPRLNRLHPPGLARRQWPRLRQGALYFPHAEVTLSPAEFNQIMVEYQQFLGHQGLGVAYRTSLQSLFDHFSKLAQKSHRCAPIPSIPPAERALRQTILDLLRSRPSRYGLTRRIWTVAGIHALLQEQGYFRQQVYAVDTLRKKMRHDWHIDLRRVNAQIRAARARKAQHKGGSGDDADWDLEALLCN